MGALQLIIENSLIYFIINVMKVLDSYKNKGFSFKKENNKGAEMMNKLKIIVPLYTISEKYLILTLDSINKNKKFIDETIFVIDKSSDKYKALIEEYLDIKLKIFSTDLDRTTKMEKLSLAAKNVDDNDYIIILDSDDNLIDLSFIIDIIPRKFDLIFSPYIHSQWEREIEIENGFFLLKFGINLQWERGNNENWIPRTYFPYFGNHSSVVKGSLFKKVDSLTINKAFQRHEDIYRTIYYIDMAESVFYQDSIPFIQRNIFKDHHHTLRDEKQTQVHEWVNILSQNMLNIGLIDVSDPWDIKTKSQISALIEIMISARDSFEFDKRNSYSGELYKDIKNHLKNEEIKKYLGGLNGYRR